VRGKGEGPGISIGSGRVNFQIMYTKKKTEEEREARKRVMNLSRRSIILSWQSHESNFCQFQGAFSRKMWIGGYEKEGDPSSSKNGTL